MTRRHDIEPFTGICRRCLADIEDPTTGYYCRPEPPPARRRHAYILFLTLPLAILILLFVLKGA